MINADLLPTAESVDILILVEGAYPLIAGGVSTWVHQIISSYPEYDFGVCFLGAFSEDYQEIKYRFPKNLKHVELHYLFDLKEKPLVQHLKGNKKSFEKIDALHDWFNQSESKQFSEEFQHVDFYLDPKKGVDYSQFLYSQCAWQRIIEKYEKYSTEPSFIDYFWTVRNIHQPLWAVAKVVSHCVKAKVVHAVSTGYAGFLGALLHQKYGNPFLLTEHGIYTKERRIELLTSRIVKNADPLQQSRIDPNYLMSMWVRFFESLSKMTYDAADPILSLYNNARNKQIEEGAILDRTQVIANGVDLEKLSPIIELVKKNKKPVIGFIGRVVPIKDVKNYIRAVKIIAQTIPDIEALIVGPEDENREYADECRDLVADFDLEKNIQFLGRQNILDILPKIRLLILSSISEGMPLTVLEAFAAGIPVVVTNVGACDELVHGFDEPSRALGSAGRTVHIASPDELAAAIIELLTDQKLWQKAQNSAIQRATHYYDEKIMISGYKQVYQKALEKWQALVSS